MIMTYDISTTKEVEILHPPLFVLSKEVIM